MIDLSIIIPVYNAQDLIDDTAVRLNQRWARTEYNYEIIFRDDGSTDDSRLKLEKVSHDFKNIRYFTNSRNRGLGFTLRELMRDAKGRYILYLDCDLPFGDENLPDYVIELNDYDVVLASRYAGNSSEKRLIRKIMSRMYHLLCFILFKVPVLDIGSGTVAMRKEAVCPLNLTADGFEFHNEFYVQCALMNLRIKEIPGDLNGKKSGSFSVLKHGPVTVFNTLRYWYALKIQKKDQLVENKVPRNV